MAGTTNFYGISYPTSTDYVKDGATAIQTVATGFDSAVAIPTYNAQTGATYTFVLADTGKTVTASNASSQTYTIPPTASVAWTANTTLRVLNLGAGVVTFAAGAGVTVTNTAQTLTQYQSARLVRTGSDAWTVTPDSGSPASATGLTLITSATWTTVTSVAVNNCFSATYDNYKIIATQTSASPGAAYQIKFRVGGVSNSSGNYSWVGAYQNITGPTITGEAGQNQTVGQIGGIGTGDGTTFVDISNPFSNSKTTTWNANAFDGQYRRDYRGKLQLTDSFDGFELIYSANMTGTVRVYGYNI